MTDLSVLNGHYANAALQSSYPQAGTEKIKSPAQSTPMKQLDTIVYTGEYRGPLLGHFSRGKVRLKQKNTTASAENV